MSINNIQYCIDTSSPSLCQASPPSFVTIKKYIDIQVCFFIQSWFGNSNKTCLVFWNIESQQQGPGIPVELVEQRRKPSHFFTRVAFVMTSKQDIDFFSLGGSSRSGQGFVGLPAWLSYLLARKWNSGVAFLHYLSSCLPLPIIESGLTAPIDWFSLGRR